MTERAAALRSGFAVLAVSSGDGDAMNAYPLDGAPTAFGPTRLAVDASGHRHVLIPVPAGTQLKTDRRSAGIQCGPQTLVEDGAITTSFLDIVCLRPHLHDVFLRIAAEIVDRLDTTEMAPDACAIHVLDRWRALLRPAQKTMPSEEQLVGLFGELVHLEELCARDPRIVSAWGGPSGAIQDFRAGAFALEVKASRSHHDWRTRIHGVLQLDTSDLDTLVLSLARVETVAQGGRSIPELIDRVLELGADSVALYNKLGEMGFDAEQLTGCAKRRFRLIDRRAWRVSEGFPRIVDSSFADGQVPNGVARVEYEIDLSGALAHAFSTAELEAFYAQLIGALL